MTKYRCIDRNAPVPAITRVNDTTMLRRLMNIGVQSARLSFDTNQNRQSVKKQWDMAHIFNKNLLQIAMILP